MSSSQTMVTGVGGPAGRAVSTYFLNSGIAVLGTDIRPISDSPHFRIVPDANSSEFTLALDDLLNEADVHLLVPTVTEELPKIALHRDAIRKKRCCVFLSRMEAIEIANDKWQTASSLMEQGIPVPRTYCGDSRTELLDTLRFPIISKPRFGRGGRGVVIHPRLDDVPALIRADRVYQEFLPGDEFDVNVFADAEGLSLVSVVLKKTALKQGLVGNALSVKRTSEPRVAELAESAVRALGLEGPIDIDIRHSTNGEPFILEINARVGANVCSAEEVLIAMIDSWRAQA